MKVLKMFLILCTFFIFNGNIINAQKPTDKKAIKMTQWEEVNEILPKYSKFTVVDMETGLEFRVQRRAGSNHADVQPLTSKIGRAHV